MSSLNLCSRVAALVASLPLTFPWNLQCVHAQELSLVQTQPVAPARFERLAIDVKLLPGRVLAGIVFDEFKRPIANAEVTVAFGKHAIIRGQTDDEGEFSMELPHGGVFLISSGTSALLVRAWSAGIAPPGAVAHVTLSARTPIIRGQSPTASTVDPVLGMLIVGGIITAITVPIVLNNTDDDDNDGSGGRNPQSLAESP